MEGIKASDVRIGNWLHFDNRIGNSYDYQVAPRFFTSSMLNEDFEVNLYHRPIPITEEWLLNFGFEVYRFGFKENQYRLKDRLIVIRNGLFCDYGTSVIIKHVHQLQNLYFALTGEELTLSK